MKYEKRLTAFIDILGFSEVVKSLNADIDENEAVFESILSTLKELKSNENKPKRAQENVETTAFSDCIVFSAALTKNSLFSIFWRAAWLQSSLLKKGFLCRGGITMNHLFHQEGIVFGAGLIEAHGIETKLAYYPRIVVHDDVIKQVKNPNILKAFLSKSEDGLYSVNPFCVRDFIGNDDDAADGNDLTEWFYMHVQDICNHEIQKLAQKNQRNPIAKWKSTLGQIVKAKNDYLQDRKVTSERLFNEIQERRKQNAQ